ncbi:PREDICTED: neuronal pentraxin-1 [Myotis brandtii]|uniref:neuronal pentraxin-1 n=1 Tax=Myotis brandtii TaxID=109478 RepID=UPI0007040D49|nr:PREDICTED: neuronal pentraxin-1 [Myotis brandtii]
MPGPPPQDTPRLTDIGVGCPPELNVKHRDIPPQDARRWTLQAAPASALALELHRLGHHIPSKALAGQQPQACSRPVAPCTPQQYSRLNSSSQTNSLKDLLQSKIDDLERQVLSRVNSLEEGKGGPKNDTEERVKIESALTSLHQRISELEKGQKDSRPGDKFQLTFPLRTNYMYAKVKRSLPEMYAFTVCMWLKSSAAPGVGTPFSYAVPGQANELVLIEWGNNPMEILINDKVGLRGAVGRRGAVSGRGPNPVEGSLSLREPPPPRPP